MVIGWNRGLLIPLLCLILLLSSCSTSRKSSRKVLFEPVSFTQISAWQSDEQIEAFHVFLKSCDAILKKKPNNPISNLTEVGGQAKSWQKICIAAKSSEIKSSDEARDFFEKWFKIYKLHDEIGKDTGRITGYYEIEMNGSRTKTNRFKYPIYQAPNDLERKKGCRGFCHASINRGALKNKQLEIVWVDSMARRFFLHIQGSGVVILKNGDTLKLHYASQNGFPYKGIGLVFKKYGIVNICSATQMMEWIDQNPRLGQQIIEENQSYVFFKEIHGESPIGGQGVPLTAERSLAIDSGLYPYGAPIWLETNLPDSIYSDSFIPYQRLMIAQDTGGAIRGPIRADLFFGRGQTAEELAGGMSSNGRMYVLLPADAKPHGSYTAKL